MITVSGSSSGPMFDGRAEAAVGEFLDEAEKDVADYGVNAVRTGLDAVLKNPTGYYRSQIQTDRAADSSLVTDGDVIYGPWLEGIESRNRTTRFRGYATFRRITQVVQSNAHTVAETTLKPFLRRMG